MVRQGAFMRSAVSVMNDRIAADPAFGESLLSTLQDVAVTNFTAKRLAEELNAAHGFEILPIDHPEGEYALGEDGFMEFRMRDGAAVEWVLNHLYTKQNVK